MQRANKQKSTNKQWIKHHSNLPCYIEPYSGEGILLEEAICYDIQSLPTSYQAFYSLLLAKGLMLARAIRYLEPHIKPLAGLIEVFNCIQLSALRVFLFVVGKGIYVDRSDMIFEPHIEPLMAYRSHRTQCQILQSYHSREGKKFKTNKYVF